MFLQISFDISQSLEHLLTQPREEEMEIRVLFHPSDIIILFQKFNINGVTFDG